MKIAITGPRPNHLGNCYSFKNKRRVKLRNYIEKLIISIIEENPKEKKFELISGLALGTDTDAFSVFIKIRKKYKDKKIILIAAIPFRSQYKRWKEDDIARYFKLLDESDEIIYVDEESEKYKLPDSIEKSIIDKKLKNRNKWIVDQLDNKKDILLGFPVKGLKHSGTNHCIEYAIKNNKRVHVTELEFKK